MPPKINATVIKSHELPRRHRGRFIGASTPAWVLGDTITALSPDERQAMRYIAAYADILIVQDTPYLLVQADQVLLDQLAAFEASVDDIEPEYEGDRDEDREPDVDREPDGLGFANPLCTPGMEWWRRPNG